MTIAVGTTVMAADEPMKGETVEMVASRHPRPEEIGKHTSACWATRWRDATLFAARIMWKRPANR